MAAESKTNVQTTEHLITAHTVSELMKVRHSARAFLPKPVPRSIIEECFTLAQHAPSNSNIQPWRAYVLEGAALQRLTSALQKARDDKLPQEIEPIPEQYKHYRSEMGHMLYGKEGYNIARSDKDGLEKAQRRNYDLFGAPLGMIIYIDSTLAPVDVLTVGLWLQSLCMLLEERDLESCIQVSVAGYPTVIRKELGIDENMSILCGLAVGYEDKNQHVNRLKTERDDWKSSVVFLSE